MNFFPPKEESALRRLLIADGLDAIGDQVTILALPTLALLLLRLPANQVSILVAVEWMPSLLLSGLIGRAVDRFDRRVVLVVAGLVAGFGAVSMAVVPILPKQLHFPTLFVACFVYAAGSLAFAIAAAASVPVVIRNMTVSDGISHQSGIRSTAKIVGQAVAGPVIQLLGAVVGVIAAALISVLRAAIVFRLPSSLSPANGAPPSAQRKLEPWRVVVSDPLLRSITLGVFAMNLGHSMIEVIFFAYLYTHLNLTPIEASIMLLAGGVGAVSAAHWSRSLHKMASARILCSLSGTVASLAVWMIPAAGLGHAFPVLIAYDLIFSVAATVFAITFSVVRQQLVPNHLLGQLASVSSTMNAGAMAIGASVVALLLPSLGVSRMIVVGCLGSSLGALVLIGMLLARPRVRIVVAPTEPRA